MNVTEANRYIPALNRIAEGVTMLASAITMLASAIEEAAWESFEDHVGMPGVRPIAAAQLAQPALKAAAEEYKAIQQQANPQPAPAKEPEPVTLEQVRGVLAELSQAGHTAKVRSLIQATGVDKPSEVDPAKYGWLVTQAEAIRDA